MITYLSFMLIQTVCPRIKFIITAIRANTIKIKVTFKQSCDGLWYVFSISAKSLSAFFTLTISLSAFLFAFFIFSCVSSMASFAFFILVLTLLFTSIISPSTTS